MRRYIVAPVLALLSILGVVGGVRVAGAAPPLLTGATIEVPEGQGPIAPFFNRFTDVQISGTNPYTVTMTAPRVGGVDTVAFRFQTATGQTLQAGTIVLDNLPAKSVDGDNGSVDLTINSSACSVATGLANINDLAFDGAQISRIALSANVFCTDNGSKLIAPSTISIWKNATPGPLGGVATSEFTPIAPKRVLDTRPEFNIGAPAAKIGTKAAISVQVSGTPGIPAEATAVVVNITALQGTAATFLTVYPTGGGTPPVSNLNPAAGETLANLGIIKLGAGGKVDVYNFAGAADALLDVTGYFAPGAASKFRPVDPVRLYDSRNTTPFGPNELRGLNVALPGIPTGISAVALNVTAVGATAPTFITVTPGNSASKATSNLNVSNATAIPNAVVVGVSSGFFNIYNLGGSIHIVVDITGYFVADGSTSGRYVPLDPARVVNTRDEARWGGKIGGDQQRYIGIHRYVKRSDAPGEPGIYPFETSAVVMNATATETTGNSYLTVFPVQDVVPTASNLNWSAGQTRANLVITGMNQWGQISAYNLRGEMDVILDVAGYFTA